jgi:acetyl-CoA carboxylase biotin carboxyl carrier protein
MDLKALYELMEKFEESGLAELTVKREGEEVTLKKAVLPAPVAYAAAYPAPAQPPVAPSGDRAAPPAGPAGEIIRAPLVGTFYRAPAPDAPPFVEKGDRVKKDQTLCVLEAMKLMNEFQAEFDLVIVDILADNGKMVEFGTPLFEVRRV